MKFQARYILLVGLLFPTVIIAQKKDENIGSEVVNVVKPYSPTLSDAYKIKEEPVLDDEESLKKEPVNYKIFSFPVASTFTPSKGRAAAVDKAAREKLYQNYVTFGIGNYLNISTELYLTHELGDNGFVSAMVRHNSSQGGIKDALVDDEFMTNSIDLAYLNKMREMNYQIDAGYYHRNFNWYGVDSNWITGAGSGIYENFNPTHNFQNAHIGGTIGVNDSFFEGMKLRYDRFWDRFDSAENHLVARPNFKFDVGGSNVKLGIEADYLHGEFSRFYLVDEKNPYTIFNISAHPSFSIQRDDWTINIGASVLYSMDSERSLNRFRVYPEAEASLKVVGDLMVFYVGAQGGMDQNTYQKLSEINPYVSPTLNITPTDRQIDGYAGLKGMLAGNVSYDVRGYFKGEKDKALFRYNMLPAFGLPSYQPYQFSNSFDVVYDDVRTIGVSGDLNADFSKTVSAGLSARFETFDTDDQEEAWNLPQLSLSGKVEVDITPKWFAGMQAFYVGKRKDVMTQLGGAVMDQTVDVDGYFDLNAHIGYKHSDRLSGFLKFNNITAQSYEKWLNYPVQGFQVMLGAGYKFDF
ncbi:TonB-dependent receptor [Flavobacterium silvaticum]|uniref:TonB-dependent receptor n=1 Tax=Flavobacterium silvaticum TaxID=1852020 RepID=A0A972JEA5_9FLAO|nr:TonB-dependent receptor [Flavobacterium silvaticum]NMH26669.1 TonB-dependent receptor [Flavobacterium silvaticum]